MNLRKIRRAVKTLTESLGRDPSDEEVARKANLPLLTVTRLRRNSTADTQSLNAPVSDADPDGGEFINFVSDDASPAPDQEMVQLEDIEQLLALLGTLSERERKVIQYRFGLDGEPVRTLDEVGAMLHCTNERVRQIQNQALRRLQREMERNQ